MINAHCFRDTFSFKKNELKSNAKGIASWDPTIIGDIIFAIFNDIVINILAKNPIKIEKQKSGNQYFLSGILNFQKGIRHRNTTNILKLPIRSGGTESLKINFWTG